MKNVKGSYLTFSKRWKENCAVKRKFSNDWNLNPSASVKIWLCVLA